MSTKLKRILVAVAFIVAAVIGHQFFHKNGDGVAFSTDLSTTAGLIHRTPASLREETFQFIKYVKVNFDFSHEVVEHTFGGTLFMDWTEETEERVATVSLAMPGHNPEVFIRARFSEDFSLRCLEHPRNLTEEESDYVLLMKNLVLDYSFRSNRDDNGLYAADFQTEMLPQGIQKVSKSKSAYVDPEKNGLKIIKSRHDYNLQNGSLILARGEEYLKLVLDQNTASAQTRYQLKAQSPTHKRPDLNFSRALGECSSDFSTQEKIIVKISPVDLKDLMLKLETTGRASRQDAARRILKALKTQPELFSDFMDWVPSTLGDRKMAAMAIGLLGNLGTPAAQKELVGIFNSATDKNKFVQNMVLNTFTLADSPLTGESREFLRSQLDSVLLHLAEGAAYALGSSIQNDPTSNASRNEVSFLVNALETATTLESKMIYLDALGNSGSPDTFTVFRKYAASDNEHLREKAIIGLRLVENGGKIGVYRAALQDPSPRVRQAASEAIKVATKQ